MKYNFDRIYICMTILLLAVLYNPGTTNAQACAGNSVQVTFANGLQTSNTEVEYDVYLTNIGSTVFKVAGFTGGMQYSSTSLPAGATPTFTAVSQPAANDFQGLNGITCSTNAGVRSLRWSNVPASEAVSVTLPPNVPKKFARVRFGSTLAWTTSTVSVDFVAVTSGALISCQVVGYCNGNPASTTLTVAAGTLALGATLNIPVTVLPLELTSFEGKALDRSNMLQWETLTEKNVKTHIIERSVDNIHWSEVGQKPGQVNSVQPLKYTLEDLAPLPKAYYRLRSVDFDGQDNKSNVILLTRKGTQFGIITITPSPTVADVSVQFTSLQEESVTVRVVDANGRLVLTQNTEAVENVNEVPLRLNGLQAGIYTVTVANSAGVSTPVRFVKQ